MYTNDNLDIIQDSQAFTHVNGVKYPSNYPKNEIIGLYPVTLTEQPTGKVVTGFHIDANHTQVWDYRDKTIDELLSEKQSLISSISPLQQQIMGKHSDVWAIKFQDSEYDDDLTAQQKQDNKTFNKKVITWRKTVRAQNNGITTANTKEEIQARIDRLNALEASYPEV